VAGPSVLMHIVDTVLWFEGDKSLTLRLLRAVKNRFGPTDEVGIFSMQDKGLVGESNPEKLFISSGRKSAPGSAITSVMQGTRPMLVEVQGLVVPTKMAYPRRIAQGIDSKRFELLLAVLSKRAGIPLYDFDCYLNVSGGISIRETASDLAICLSIASAYFDKALPPKSLVIGEVGLLGDVREVVAQEKRVKEAKRLGYKNIISSDSVKSIGASIKKYIKFSPR
jgi:DNA repair protein RadA/Sms